MNDDMQERLRRKHAEGQGKATVRELVYQDTPEELRPKNRLSNTALFMPSRYRRRGYVLKVNCYDFASAMATALTPKRERALLDKWLRGEMWRPPIITVRLQRHHPFHRLVIVSTDECDVMVFLAERQPFAIVQVLEEGDPPASLEALKVLTEALTANFFPVVSSRVVL